MDLKNRTAEDWSRILAECGVAAATAAKHAPAFAAVLAGEAFSMGEDELDDFLGQILHESAMLEHLVENLNYSAEGLRATFPSHFTEEEAEDYKHQPARIANRAYASRMGNGDEDSGDGWKYRGRAHIMGTGAEAYRFATEHFGDELGVNFMAEPDRLAEPELALRFSLAWWEGHVPDAFIGNLVKVTKRVNAGTNGIAHRKQVTEAAWRALNA